MDSFPKPISNQIFKINAQVFAALVSIIGRLSTARKKNLKEYATFSLRKMGIRA